MEFVETHPQQEDREKYTKIETCENSKEVNEEDEKRGSILPQFISCISAFISVLNFGVMNTWSSPALPYLKSHNASLPLTDSEGAWIAALPSLGLIIGILTFPILINWIGRRYAILFFAILQTLSAILLIISENKICLYVARIIGGSGSGGAVNVIIIYLGEIAEKRIRGMAMSFMHVSKHIGLLIVAILGAYSSYNTMNWILLSIPISFLVFFFFMVESPYFYLMKGKDVWAIKTLMKLRGVNNAEDVMEDIHRIKKNIVESRNSERKIWREILSDRICRNNIILGILALATNMFAGFYVVAAFTQEILTESGSTLDPKTAAMILGAMDVITTIPSSQFIDHFSRRKLFLFTGILIGVDLAIIALYFYLKYNLKFDVSSISLLPLICLVFYHCLCNMGFTVIPFVYMSELFPIRVKGPSVALVSIWAGLFSFSSKLIFQALRTAGGLHLPFWIFSVCAFTGTCLVFWLAPETKGKNLEEIQAILKRKYSKNRNLTENVLMD